VASMPIDRVDALLHVPVGACGTPQGDTTMRESRVMFSPDSRMGSAGSYVSHQHTNNGRAASQEAGAEAPAQALGPAPQGHSHSVKAAAPDASMSITRCVDASAPQGATDHKIAASISSLMGVGAAAPQGALCATRRSRFDEHHKVCRCGSTTRCTPRTTRCRHFDEHHKVRRCISSTRGTLRATRRSRFDEHHESSMRQHRKARPTKTSPSLKQSRLCTVLYRAVLVLPRPSPPSTRPRQPHP